MSPQLVLDEHLAHEVVTESLKSWITVEQIGFELKRKGLSDEEVIRLLRRLKRRTLVTLDKGFYAPKLCDRNYCLVYFDVTMARQSGIPLLLRRLFRLPGFRTIRERMGKVVRVHSDVGVSFYTLGDTREHHLPWPPGEGKA